MTPAQELHCTAEEQRKSCEIAARSLEQNQYRDDDDDNGDCSRSALHRRRANKIQRNSRKVIGAK
jgi:hypothetical protein